METLSWLRCPSGCEDELHASIHTQANGRIIEGELDCPACGRRYVITEGIAILLPGGLTGTESAATAVTESVEVERKRSEMAARDAQVEDYDRMRGLALFGKLEIPVTLRMLQLRPTDTLLEAGCGTGRMTPTFASRCRSMIAVDFSLESLKVCQRKLKAGGVSNVDLVQADVCHLPFRTERFTRVVSCQVLEHIPTPESRARMVRELARVTDNGGNVVLSAYQHSFFTRLFDRKEGAHAGGIYYYRFHRRELRDLLATALNVQSLTGVLVYHYLARCRKTQGTYS